MMAIAGELFLALFFGQLPHHICLLPSYNLVVYDRGKSTSYKMLITISALYLFDHINWHMDVEQFLCVNLKVLKSRQGSLLKYHLERRSLFIFHR